MLTAVYRFSCLARLLKRLSVPVAVWLALCSALPAHAETTDEAAVRSAMIFNLLKFTKWPEDLPADAPLRICAIDASAGFVAALRSLETRRVGEHPLQIKAANAKELDACEIIATDSAQTLYAPAQTETRNALTIGEAGFIDRGGMVGITVIDNRVRFEINLEAMKRSGISLPSQVLQLAVRTR